MCSAAFLLGRFWGRVGMLRQILRNGREDPKSVHDWAEELRAAELESVKDDQGGW
jgi:hypothetical protein